MKKKIIEFISAYDKNNDDGYLHIIEKYNNYNGFFYQGGTLVFVTEVLFDEKKTITETKYMTLKTNFKLEKISNNRTSEFKEGRYNFIYFNGINEYHLTRSFINLCDYYYKNRQTIPLDTFILELSKLFTENLIEEKLDEIGLFGELYFLYYLYEKYKIDLSKGWNIKGKYSKLDFTLKNINLEVKTTTSYDNVIKLKHDQLFNSEQNYLCIIKIKENNYGMSIGELINEIKDTLLSKNIEFILKLEKILINYSISDEKYKSTNIYIYDSKKLVTFPYFSENIKNIVYDYDFSDISSLKMHDFVNILKKDLEELTD